MSAVSYAARFSEDAAAQPDVFFRWTTAIGTFVLDAILLVLTLLIARGLAFREAFALRRPPSWAQAGKIALVALGATWTTSLVLEITVGHDLREQTVPSYYDATRLGAFVANLLAVAVFVPIVEESMVRGLGFFLMAPRGHAVAIVGTSVAFALAHGAVLDLPWVLVTGLGLGYLRSRTGSLYPSIALHMFVNGTALLASALLAANPPVG